MPSGRHRELQGPTTVSIPTTFTLAFALIQQQLRRSTLQSCSSLGSFNKDSPGHHQQHTCLHSEKIHTRTQPPSPTCQASPTRSLGNSSHMCTMRGADGAGLDIGIGVILDHWRPLLAGSTGPALLAIPDNHTVHTRLTIFTYSRRCCGGTNLKLMMCASGHRA